MAEGAASGLRRTVLFDFDGVLVRGDAFGLLMRDHYSRQWWRRGLVVLAAPWLLLVLPFSRRRALRALVRLGLVGVSEARYRELAQSFAGALARQPGRFCREGLRALRQHQIAGDRIVVVTGCEESLVRGVLGELGVADVEVLASRLRAGRFGMRPDWHNVGPRKVELLARHGIDACHVAYSDSRHDLPILALAADAVLVNAAPKLCKRVEKALGRSVIRAEWR
ncbi:MAG TPA: haloacid dehalogenase-like hydrolase [Rhodanobacteraceae bacterium]|nr:haloacid dehalogenase-like hydrolase [Rhodanobacteraceae bacterium]